MRAVLGWVWMAPMAAIMWLYALPAWAFGWWQLLRVDRGVAVFAMVATEGWYARAWRGWRGFSAPTYVVLRLYSAADAPSVSRTGPADWAIRKNAELERHERHHEKQWRTLGLLFPLVYAALWVGFGYREHPLEVSAVSAERDTWDA